MIQTLIEVLGAFVACAGFSFIYKTRSNRIFWCGFSGGATWAVCCLAEYFLDNLFINFLIAAAFGTLLSEILARLTKSPATIYLIPALLPMVPGGSLYYTTFALVMGNHEDARYFGQRTAIAALGIAVGLVIVTVLTVYWNEIKSRRTSSENKE